MKPFIYRFNWMVVSGIVFLAVLPQCSLYINDIVNPQYVDSDGDGDGDGDADGDGDGDADGDGEGDADGDGDGDADGDSDGDADGDSDGDADGDSDGDADGDTGPHGPDTVSIPRQIWNDSDYFGFYSWEDDEECIEHPTYRGGSEVSYAAICEVMIVAFGDSRLTPEIASQILINTEANIPMSDCGSMLDFAPTLESISFIDGDLRDRLRVARESFERRFGLS